MDATHLIGNLLEGPQERDAVHIAVAPVIAGEDLMAGERIGFKHGGGTEIAYRPDAYYPIHDIGIVDPFLKQGVAEGERFFMFLYPRTITSLRHNWTHPAFGPEPRHGAKSPSEQWLRDFAESVSLAYGDMMEGANDWVQFGYHLCRGGLLEGKDVPDEFWDHYQHVTGATVDRGKRENFFTCSC